LLHIYPLDPELEKLGSLNKPPSRITTRDVSSEEKSIIPFDADQTYFDVTVRCNRRITAEDWFQDVRHLELVSDCDIK